MTEGCRIRPFSPLVWFILPGALLVWITLFTPHALDLAASRVFYMHDGFVLNRAPLMLFFHTVSRVVPFAFGFAGLYAAIQNLRGRPYWKGSDFHIETRRTLYLLAAMLAAVFLVKFLKNMTGVFCPVNVTEFGGSSPLVSPSWSWTTRPGHCWPSGFAGTGFCLFALYFTFRDWAPKLAKMGLAATYGVGIFCGVLQVMRGEHFLTHVIGACLFDWFACLFVYMVFFAPEFLVLARQWRARAAALPRGGERKAARKRHTQEFPEALPFQGSVRLLRERRGG